MTFNGPLWIRIPSYILFQFVKFVYSCLLCLSLITFTLKNATRAWNSKLLRLETGQRTWDWYGLYWKEMISILIILLFLLFLIHAGKLIWETGDGAYLEMHLISQPSGRGWLLTVDGKLEIGRYTHMGDEMYQKSENYPISPVPPPVHWDQNNTNSLP